MSGEITFTPITSAQLFSISANAHTIVFYGPNYEKVGVFDFGKAPVTFEGDADASAKIFVDLVIRNWGSYLIPPVKEPTMPQEPRKDIESPLTPPEPLRDPTCPLLKKAGHSDITHNWPGEYLPY